MSNIRAAVTMLPHHFHFTCPCVTSSLDWTPEQWKEIKDVLDLASAMVLKRLTRPWLLVEWIFALTADGKKWKTMKNMIHDYFKGFITKLVDGGVINEEKATFKTKKLQSISDIILHAVVTGKGKLTEDETVEECIGLFGAGMDTSANVMAYVLILLGMHPEYQERLVEEQEAIFQDSLRPATNEDLPKMVILDLVIKEALRLFPPVAIMTREIPEDLPISQGRVLPAGCSVFVSNYSIHRDAANFEEPERFWPERWTPENSVGRHPYAFLPFSAGQRNCIGQKYAQLQMKTTLSSVLRRFRFTSGYSLQELKRIEIGVTNNSAVGYNVQVYSR